MKKLEAVKNWAEEKHVSAGHEFIGPDKIREVAPWVTKRP